MTRRVWISDVTLREGQQAIDAWFSPEEKLELVGVLAELGVDSIQLGHPRADRKVLAWLAESPVGTPIECVCPVFNDEWRANLEEAAAAGVSDCQLIMRSPKAHLALVGLDPERARRRLEDAIGVGVARGLHISVGLSYAASAEREFVVELCRIAEAAGASRVVLADSVGRMPPEDMADLVAATVQAVSLPVGVHCHDDFGLALASTLSSIRAGASWAESSLCGVGERAGNAPTEQVAVALTVLYRYETNIRLDMLRMAAEAVAGVLRSPIPGQRPLVGRDVFTSKIDLHAEGLAERPELFLPFDPAIVGAAPDVRVGAGSGNRTLQAKLKNLGLTIPSRDLSPLRRRLHQEAGNRKRAILDEELVALLGEVSPSFFEQPSDDG